MKKINLKFSHFEELHKKGYSLDMIYLLELIDQQIDVETVCCEMPKLDVLCQTIHRKGLVTNEYKLTIAGRELLEFINTAGEDKLVKKKISDDSFELWWKTYPGTDTFKHKGKQFEGTRSLRIKKDECKIKFNKILGEGEYKTDDLVKALEYEVLQKKENSVKTVTNKMSFMQNSLTYLNQRTFEPFIELIKEGHIIKETNQVSGGTDV